MSRISSDMLSSTLNLVALTRQTALAKGQEDVAEKVAPVENKLRELVYETRNNNQDTSTSGVMGQSDFQRLLAVKKTDQSAVASDTTSSLERNQIVSAMAAGGMSELDIARQMGMSREEVQIVVNLGRRHTL